MEYERLGAKVLSLPDVIAQSVGFMGPVFSSAFVIPLVVGVVSASGKGGGVAAPLSVLIAAVGVFAIGWIVSSYAREIHAAGSLYDYVSHGLGARVGTAAGWLYYTGITVLVTGLMMLIDGYLQALVLGRRLGRDLLRRAVRRAAFRRLRDRRQPGRRNPQAA
jgi:amino acid transporter